VGIYDTKAGRTVTERATYDKSDALQTYIAKESSGVGVLTGGILNRRPEGLFIYDEPIYTPELNHWNRFMSNS
jgi:hypothetical protein